VFKGFYMDSSLELSGLAGKMTDRSIPHIRRIAMILALVDMSEVVESKHIKAARSLWDYCQESAEYVFSGTTKDQNRIISWVRQHAVAGPVTVTMVTQELFHKNKKADWIRGQITELVRLGKLVEADGQIRVSA
jgi:DNA replicative helicase MCM subunit Mcm2 (Cdc46/Mcm family)